jgi:choline dehydrogenase-like flavoprotein
MIMGKKEIPDVCIIGAGLVGGITAYELAKRWVKVVVLEAGPRYGREKFAQMEKALKRENPWASNYPERDVYTNAGEIIYSLNANRVKAVGGSTLHWAAHAERWHETDFKMKSFYGMGDDWPINYEELEPYYGKAEIALGVAGIADNPFASHRSTDFPLPSFPFSYGDELIKKACDKLNITVHHAPCARNSVPYQDRPACLTFGTCKTCPIGAKYTAEAHIRLAEATGNVQVFSNTPVVRINVDAAGKIRSVTFVEIEGKIEHEQKAQVFVLAAHAVESARLLLLSQSGSFPMGLANGSGLVGKNFMEHPEVGVVGRLKQKVFPFRVGFSTAESNQFRQSRGEEAG